MVLIICTSHLYIPATISIINDKFKDVCLYTDRESIYSFLKNLYQGIDIYLLPKMQEGNKICAHITRTRVIKASMKNFFAKKSIDEIIFFHEGFCIEANWLIKYLYKNNGSRVIYIPVERTFDFETKWEEETSFRYILRRLYFFWIWGIPIHFYKYMNSIYPIMDKSFYESVKCREMQKEIETVDVVREIDKTLLDPIKYPPTGIVWLENTLRVFSVSWNRDSYEKFIDDVFSQFPMKRLFFKGHPDQALKYGKEAQMQEIPSFIPGNLLLNRFFCYIGVISDLMFEAANAGTLTISTLYLFDIESADREMLADYLRNKSEKILFPKTVFELMSIINRVNTHIS